MLAALQEGIDHYGLDGLISPRRLAWDDAWETAGIGEGSVDVAIASRSIATADLKGALLKLTRTARRRCCISMIANASPRQDARVVAAIGATVVRRRDFIYALNILFGLGLSPELRYIRSQRRDTFDSLDAATADYARMLEPHDRDKVDALRAYLDRHLIDNPQAGAPGEKGRPQGRLMLDHPRIVPWAFISWNVGERTGRP